MLNPLSSTWERNEHDKKQVICGITLAAKIKNFKYIVTIQNGEEKSFDKDEYQKGIKQVIMEVMETRRILQESIDDLIDKVPNPPEYIMEKLGKLKC